MWRTKRDFEGKKKKEREGEEKNGEKKKFSVHCLWPPQWVPANQQSLRKIKEDKEIWEKRNYFSAFLFPTEDDEQTACPGVILPDSEGEPLARSDVLNERVKGQEN